MDRFEKWAEYIMQHGDKIIEEKKHRNMLIRRVSFSCASAFAVAIVGFFAWKSIPPKPEFPNDIIIHENSEVVTSTKVQDSEQITTSVVSTLVSSSKTTMNNIVTTSVTNQTSKTSEIITETMSSKENDQTVLNQTEVQTTVSFTTVSQSIITLPVTVATTQIVTESVTTHNGAAPSSFPIIRLYHSAAASETQYTEMKKDEVVKIETDYNPVMGNWSGIGILLEFNSKDYPIVLSTNEGHFTTWDKETGSGIVSNVGNTYNIGNEGYIFWTPDQLNYDDDFESEIIIMGENNSKRIEIGKLVVNMNDKHTLSAVLKEISI